MKRSLLLLAVLALALPVFAQNPSCSSTPILVSVRPAPGVYVCSKGEATWTLAYSNAHGGEIQVDYDGPKGQFSWEQSVLWSPTPVRYQACNGSVCWHFTQHLVKSCYDCTNLFLEGPFKVN